MSVNLFSGLGPQKSNIQTKDQSIRSRRFKEPTLRTGSFANDSIATEQRQRKTDTESSDWLLSRFVATNPSNTEAKRHTSWILVFFFFFFFCIKEQRRPSQELSLKLRPVPSVSSTSKVRTKKKKDTRTRLISRAGRLAVINACRRQIIVSIFLYSYSYFLRRSGSGTTKWLIIITS